MWVGQAGFLVIQNKLSKDILKGDIDPEQGLSKFEFPGRHISEIECSLESEPLPCGFKVIEEKRYFRLNRPDLYILAARPGMGKTSLVCQVSLNVANTLPVLVFSIEMNAASLKERLLAVESQRPIKKIPYIMQSDPELIQTATRRLNTKKLTIDDTNGLTLSMLEDRARSFKKANPNLGLIVVDYLQIVNIPSMRSKTEEVSTVARKLKELAKELNCPVLSAAQNNRNIEGRSHYIDYESGEVQHAKTRPMMSDLADSAGIEKWADLVMFIERPWLIDRTRPAEADIYVVKNRNGEAEDFVLGFNGEMTRFYDKA